MAPRDRAAGLWLFLCFQGLFALTASGRVDRVPDEFETYLQVEGLVDRGSLAMPEHLAPGAFFGRVGVDGRRYAPYGPGVAFLAVPHHLAARAVAWTAGVDRGRSLPAWTELVASLTTLASATFAALAVWGAFAACRALGASLSRALAVAVALGAATPLWHYGTVFFSEAFSAATVAWAAAWLLQGRVALGAVALAALVATKATALVFVPALALLALREPPRDVAALRALARRAWPLLLGVGLACVAHMEWNRARFGNAFEFGYDWSEQLRPGEAPRAFLLSALPGGVAGLLLAPGKSLLLFAPPLVLAALRLGAARAARPPLVWAWGLGMGTALAFFGSYFYWEGGYAFGPRHLVPLLPLGVLPLACGPAPPRAAYGAALALGISLELLGVSVSYLEDQAGGIQEGRSSAYYELHPPDSPAVPPGRPLNVYRWSYAPQLTYPPRIAAHLAAPPGPGMGGLDYLPLHLARVRRTLPGCEELPLWPGWLLALAAAGLTAAGAARVRRQARPSPRGSPA